MPPQTVKEVLREAKPDWTNSEMEAVLRKMEHARIHTIEDLEEALDDKKKGWINYRLQQLSLKTFTDQTLAAFKAVLKGEKVAVARVVVRRQEGEEDPMVPVPPVVAQRYNVTIENDRMISKSTRAGWGVAMFEAPADFDLSIQFERDAGALVDPWTNYIIVGLVPWHVKTAHIAASDQPWDSGIWVAPCASPLQIWTKTRGPHNNKPIQVPDLPSALKAGQTLQLRRNTSGVVGLAVDDMPTVELPASTCWAGCNKDNLAGMRPVIVMGTNTAAKVHITLFGDGSAQEQEAPRDQGAPVLSATTSSTEDDQQASGSEDDGSRQGQREDAPARQDSEPPEFSPQEAIAPETAPQETALREPAAEEPQPAANEQEPEQELVHYSRGQKTEQEKRFEEIERARVSKRYSVGDLVGFFETKTISKV